MQDSKLLVVLAQPGQGKTTILQALLDDVVGAGVVVSVPRELRLPAGKPVFYMKPSPTVDLAGTLRLARTVFRLRRRYPYGFLVVDDAETWFDALKVPHRENPFRRVIQFARNLQVNIVLVAKDPLDFTRQVRNVARLFVVHPGGDADVLAWLRKARVPVDPLPDGVFLVGSPPGPWERLEVAGGRVSGPGWDFLKSQLTFAAV